MNKKEFEKASVLHLLNRYRFARIKNIIKEISQYNKGYANIYLTTDGYIRYSVSADENEISANKNEEKIGQVSLPLDDASYLEDYIYDQLVYIYNVMY